MIKKRVASYVWSEINGIKINLNRQTTIFLYVFTWQQRKPFQMRYEWRNNFDPPSSTLSQILRGRDLQTVPRPSCCTRSSPVGRHSCACLPTVDSSNKWHADSNTLRHWNTPCRVGSSRHQTPRNRDALGLSSSSD